MKVCVKEDESYLAALNCFVVVSLYKPIGKKGDERFALESILENPANENTEERDNGKKGFYKKIADFLMGEYFNQRNENRQLKSKEIELKN